MSSFSFLLANTCICTCTPLSSPRSIMANAQELDRMRRLEELLRSGNVEETSKIIEEILLAQNDANGKPDIAVKPKPVKIAKQIRVCLKLENWQVDNQVRIHVFMETTATVGDIRKILVERYGMQSELLVIYQDQRILKDEQTLAQVGVLQDGQGLVVYVKQDDQDQDEDQEENDEHHLANVGAKVANNFGTPQPGYSGYAQAKPPQPVNITGAGYDFTALPKPQLRVRRPDAVSELKRTPQVQPGQIFASLNVKKNVLKEEPVPAENPGWACAICTYINLPYRPGCEQCATARPEDYRVPANYVATDAERAWYDQDQNAYLQEADILEEAFRRPQIAPELLQADDIPLLRNEKEFECKICFTPALAGDGARLRNCLHEFCLDCLRGHIQASQDAAVKCPFADDEYKCDEVIEDREIREIVDQETFEKYKQRGLQQAEAAAPNSFHCQTANCKGWCIVEEDANFFRCDLCKAHNCLLCKAIHTGMNCKQYQDDLRIRSANDLAARATQELLEREIREGNAMRCPQCNIILQKKVGCDWLQCSMCKCEICWVTKGPRWGPKGNGDVSGGCRCRVGGKLCMPNCGNCH